MNEEEKKHRFWTKQAVDYLRNQQLEALKKDLRSADNDLPLARAAKRGDLTGLKKALSAGAAVNDQDRTGCTALLSAAWHGQGDCARELLKAGADPEVAGRSGKRALHWAAENGNLELVRDLLAAGARVDEPGKKGARPLALAAASGHMGSVKVLVEAGADLSACGEAGANAEQTARYCGNDQVADWLAAAALALAGAKQIENVLDAAGPKILAKRPRRV